MWKYFALLLITFFPIFSVSATDCLSHKLNPTTEMTVPQWSKKIERHELVGIHGDVESTLNAEFNLNVLSVPVDGGYCVVLKSVGANIGYADFVVRIDKKYEPDTCEYNAVLYHEDSHINAHLSVLDEFKNKLKDAVDVAAESVMPVFVSSNDDVDDAIIKINEEMQSHPDFILVKQKIESEIELRNTRIDQDEDGARMKQCESKSENNKTGEK